ncbi:hypothetical protein ACHAXS_005633 [Conticribra weissflogii]
MTQQRGSRGRRFIKISFKSLLQGMQPIWHLCLELRITLQLCLHYARFNDKGIPTHDMFNEPLKEKEIAKSREQMKQKKRKVGDASTVMEFQSREKRVDDASLIFQGLVVIR